MAPSMVCAMAEERDLLVVGGGKMERRSSTGS